MRIVLWTKRFLENGCTIKDPAKKGLIKFGIFSCGPRFPHLFNHENSQKEHEMRIQIESSEGFGRFVRFGKVYGEDS